MYTCFKSIKKKCSLIDWLDYIQNLNPVLVDLNLDRIKKVATVLKLIPFQIYSILVGGTNGKGTTCYLLEQILLFNNFKVGLYTSPHLLSYSERIRVCGKQLPDDIHIKSMSVVENARSGVLLTYFEFITLSALNIFKQFKLDLVILEVGLGGRLDATNIIDPDISVITNIAIDHVDFLGDTRYKIAIEKSGIFRVNRPAIVGEIDRPLVIDEIAKNCSSILFARGRDWDFYCCKDNTWIWRCYSESHGLLINFPMPLSIPLENAAVVLSILHWLPFKVSRKSIEYGLQNAVLLGRFQVVNYNPFIVLDVGHNPHAAAHVKNKLHPIVLKRKGIVRIVIGMLSRKDVKSTVLCLNNLIDVWYCADLNTPCSANMKYVFDCFSGFDVKYFEDIISAWYKAVDDSDIDDCILVFGSFYAVHPILKLILKIM
ncbi:bifunctional protein folC [Candidatus Blochmanniella vafra str. BVAF]|uniref:Dihydrofolate synthase/folylpolyglutamate synthase n=1 Tax=Blochmanniella vafra (strain BVAF) TaxID=859654 RepID=E8Q757_BLOVB|nr:bifunctional tetrahydrofolate synthase/dihydrofolate synthase [Candidatus Blochmannia vafer]ADV33881.1 bifunctional protein folC [Candidatus Blochmannia vafer str. BVAF]